MLLASIHTEELLRAALLEDTPYLDLSSVYLFQKEHKSTAQLRAKKPGVLCGLDLFCRAFTLLDEQVQCQVFQEDGAAVLAGEIVAEVTGSTASLLQAERTALNFVQHLSGIATATHAVVEAVSGTGVRIVDTRKTLPGLRALQKAAVLCGGGYNHRMGLSDGVMLKDNHIDAAGSITQAVQTVRAQCGHMIKIEVETRTLAEVQEAVSAHADVIMLDNMTLAEMREAVLWVRGSDMPRVLLEASGDITVETARAVAKTGVDVISLGALTHSVHALDLSLTIKPSL